MKGMRPTHENFFSAYSENIATRMLTTISSLVLSVAVHSMKILRVLEEIFE